MELLTLWLKQQAGLVERRLVVAGKGKGELLAVRSCYLSVIIVICRLTLAAAGRKQGGQAREGRYGFAREAGSTGWAVVDEQ